MRPTLPSLLYVPVRSCVPSTSGKLHAGRACSVDSEGIRRKYSLAPKVTYQVLPCPGIRSAYVR